MRNRQRKKRKSKYSERDLRRNKVKYPGFCAGAKEAARRLK